MTVMVPSEMILNGRRGWCAGSRRQQLFTFTEAERYEMLITLEGRQVRVHYGRTSATFQEIEALLVGVAYPLDSGRQQKICELILRDEETGLRTIRSSSIRMIEVLDDER